MFSKYKKKNKLKFRVRSSVKTSLYISTHEDQIPRTFEFYQRIYRCTHGVPDQKATAIANLAIASAKRG
ncbi:hypothetical protein PHMEG_00016648 [Phytophthora megakarya]|uniref:Uncharacterized protein n=1 Tax=Phytophthora megakarya TaxID=4795 RepID=A0A225VZZ9_9STRA|nr:hypothetical protein PHMEG_00016648 [Phytophthora megakarya]